ncbi:MAG: ATP-dependent RecD-like DNA helicase [Oscillospiraceae bacterium]|nr:ATP-dependent RecD-like DNA helicase [Oscillospiraceae bacterium]
MDIELQELSGTVESVTFRNAENGFTVFDFDSGGTLTTVVGVLPEVQPGELLNLRGTWQDNAQWGRQFRVELCEQLIPHTAAQMLKYLSSGTVKGIGPATAQKIVEAFGDRTFDVLENSPGELLKIRGMSEIKAKLASDDFKKQFALRSVMIALEQFGMTPAECTKTYKVFGVNAADTVRRNPYALCEERIGIGFDRADVISVSLPEPPQAGMRTRAGIMHVLRQAQYNDGHTCLPREEAIRRCSQVINAPWEDAEEALEFLLRENALYEELFAERHFVFLPPIHKAENSAAARLKVFLEFPPAGSQALDDEIAKVEAESSIVYGKLQREAIRTAAEKGMLILTGGPGTGKTTAIRGILSLFRQQGLEVALAAPTGRAAKRMSELAGCEAKTIHRLLEAERTEDNRPPRFQRNAQNLLGCQALILDELSMVDAYLFAAVLDALPLGCRLVMVGDADQLPAVGAGNVLHDLLSADTLPAVRLTKVYRQAMESLIVENAHRIIDGEPPLLREKNRDFFFLSMPNPALCGGLVRELVAERLPKAYGFDPLTSIQVLCPSRKGATGTISLNALLQNALNPAGPGKSEHPHGSRIFREGDKVMQMKNNYDLEWEDGLGEKGRGIFNGELGILRELDLRGREMLIEFDSRLTSYPIDKLEDLDLAYAVTVHKSQGSEFEAVVLPVCGVPTPLAYRSLLYTAVTRAKRLFVGAGNREELLRMTANVRAGQRFSGLAAFLQE